MPNWQHIQINRAILNTWKQKLLLTISFQQKNKQQMRKN